MTTIQQKIKDPDNPLTEEVLTLRKHRWDEEDRLRGVDLMPDNEAKRPEISSYTYDASGERVVRYVPGRLDAFYNASNTGFSDRLESFVYPSGLLTAKTLKGMNINKQIMTYTKHYYIGSERISSVIGTGNSVGYNICISDFPSSSDLAEMNQKVTQAAQALQDDYDYFEKHLSLSQAFAIRPSCGISSIGTETPYWFHPDHLGSSSYISNLNGEISQHLEYLPFGETLVEEHKNSNNSPYKFNAKELDDETGNYYYGARYLNPKWSFWLSVDPLAEDYHGWAPYIYTANNPIRYIDPDGRKITDPESKVKAAQMKLSFELKSFMIGKKQNIIILSATNRKGKVRLNRQQKAQLSQLGIRRTELSKSIQDINDMINDPNNYYEFRDASQNNGKPQTLRISDNTVALYNDSFGNDVHEARHGGQIARGEFDINTNSILISGSYGANKEIDAYRAELGAMGEINFEPYRDYNSFENLKKIGQKDSLINFEDITNNFLQRVVDNPGINQERVYGTPQDNPNFYEN